MSYTMTYDKPNDLEFYIENGELFIRFTCPRCHHQQTHAIGVEYLASCGFEIECQHASCRKPDERFGYSMSFDLQFSSLELGTNDRPLHSEVDHDQS